MREEPKHPESEGERASSNVVADERDEHRSPYSRLFEEVPVGVYRVSLDGRILAANPAMLAMLGYESLALLAEVDFGSDLYVEPAERRQWLEAIRSAGRVSNQEVVLRRRDGKRIVVLDSAIAIRDEMGEILHCEGTLTEITSLRRAQDVGSVALQILQAAGGEGDLGEILGRVREELSKLLDTANFYVALYDAASALYSFPCHVDECEPDEQPPQALPGSLTDYVRRTGEPLLADERLHQELMEAGEVELVGAPSAVWLGAPLRTGDEIVGVVSVQSYSDSDRYTDEDLQILSLVSETITQVIQRKRAEEKLRSSEKRFRDLFEASPDAIFVEDIDGNVLDVNPAGSELQGIPRQKLIGMNLRELVPPDEIEEVLARHRRLVLGEQEQVEAHTLTAAGDTLPVEVRASPVEFGDRRAALIQVRDVTERREHEERLEQLARYDTLTGLPNRFLFEDRLRQALMMSRRSGDRVALHYLDLDEFKQVNDTLGHSAGDKLLERVGERLARIVRDSDTLARLGGDEFAIVQTHLDGATGASAFALRVIDAMNKPFKVRDNELHVSTSIGIALSGRGDDPESLRLQADRALYKAKEKGRNTFHFHDVELAEEVEKYVSVRNDLDGALERDEFFLDYQPQYDLNSGEIVGCEALVRWQHPTRGLLPPSEFIAVTEKTGLIVPIGSWVMREACRQRNEWNEAGLREVPTAVNLSAIQFRDQRFTPKLLELLDKSNIRPDLLELELTETVLLQGPSGVRDALLAAHEKGVSIAIDDFGTGYSSMQYLREFPVTKLKIAMEFVRDITVDPDDAAIVAAMISLGHRLGTKVLAEGVETAEQAEFLRREGCDEAQGYFFSRPLSAADFAARLGE